MVRCGSSGGVRMVVQIASVDGSDIRWLWLWMEALMLADGGGSGVWWLWWWLAMAVYGGGGG